MSGCCGKRYGKTPCHCKEYTLEVVEHSLAEGTATLQIRRDGAPLPCQVVGVSFCIIAPNYCVEAVCDKCCKQYVTNKDGLVNVTFDANAENQVRINVNIQLGACSTDAQCCIRLTKCLAPREMMDACPLSYLSMNEGHQSCGKCCCK